LPAFRGRAQTVYRRVTAYERDVPALHGEDHMLDRSAICAVALAAALCLPVGGVRAQEDARFPDLSGQWKRPPGVGIQWDQTKPIGRAQQPPLTPEYQAVWEASMADQAAGGQGNDAPSRCVPYGMPRIMTTVFPMEIVVTQNATHLLSDYTMPRRIYTDGREFPKEIEPGFNGYSIGKWVDENGDGRYDVLEIETRGLKGPRSYDASGIPFHQDNETVVKERMFVDKTNPDILHDEITTSDHSLTRPWTVTKNFVRDHAPIWFQNHCSEDNRHVTIGTEDYVLSFDGYLMPAKKDQKPPDLKYFKQTKN
jgi:hypothetical protein